MRKFAVVAALGLLLISSCGKKPEPLALATPGYKGVTPVVLNQQKPGAEVDLSQYVGKDNKYTLVEYGADWCGPCQNFLPVLNMLPSKFTNLTVYRINIDKWGSPVCKKDKINSVPAFVVFAPDGKEIARGDAAKDWLQAQLDLLSR